VLRKIAPRDVSENRIYASMGLDFFITGVLNDWKDQVAVISIERISILIYGLRTGSH
jgi:hypothetical protein